MQRVRYHLHNDAAQFICFGDGGGSLGEVAPYLLIIVLRALEMSADETFSFYAEPVGKQKSGQGNDCDKNQENNQVDIFDPFEMQ